MKARAVIAALTAVDPKGYGGWGGECPGCDLDKLKVGMWLLERPHFEDIVVLYNERATWEAFSRAIRMQAAGLLPGDLLVIYRSGHGGRALDISGDELDGYDETLCMWDRQVLDDEMWELLCEAIPAGVRVALITDACHSETAWRGAPAVGFQKDDFRFKGRLLALSGCADDMVSWGDGTNGGRFTKSLDERLRKGMTWAQWFEAAMKRMGKGQVPKLAEYGESFKEELALG